MAAGFCFVFRRVFFQKGPFELKTDNIYKYLINVGKYLVNIWTIILGGTTSRSLRCKKGHSPGNIFGGGGPLPGPQGVWRDMYGTVYVPTYYTVLSACWSF